MCYVQYGVLDVCSLTVQYISLCFVVCAWFIAYKIRKVTEEPTLRYECRIVVLFGSVECTLVYVQYACACMYGVCTTATTWSH